MAARQEPGQVEGPGASEDFAAGWTGAAANHPRGQPNVDRMVCLLPAQQTDHVCERGRLRAAPVAAGALEAPRQAREREGYGPTTLAEPLVCGSRVADFGSRP